MATALHIDPVYLKHDTGRHPECAARLEAIRERFDADGLTASCRKVPLRTATDDEVLLVHTRPYLETAKRDILRGDDTLSTGDTAVCRESLDVALQAAGSLLNCVDQVIGGDAANAFCATRPPGHHATADRGMGFCILNNAAIAARYAQQKHGLKRVAVIDWDVHHGNGTQDIFYEDGSVFYFSTHQSPWYPGTGKTAETGTGAGRGTTLNRPFAAGSGMEEIGQAFRRDFIPLMDDFRPELVIISAGFDSRLGDPLGSFKLTDADFASLSRVLMEIAEKHAKSRVVSVLEGGYSIQGLADAASAHVKTLTGATDFKASGQTEEE